MHSGFHVNPMKILEKKYEPLKRAGERGRAGMGTWGRALGKQTVSMSTYD